MSAQPRSARYVPAYSQRPRCDCVTTARSHSEDATGAVKNLRKASTRRLSSSWAPTAEELRTYSVTTVVMLTTVILLRTTTWPPSVAGLDGGGGGDDAGGTVGNGVAVTLEDSAATVVGVLFVAVATVAAAQVGFEPQHTTLQLLPLVFVVPFSLKEQAIAHNGENNPSHERSKLPAQWIAMHAHELL